MAGKVFFYGSERPLAVAAAELAWRDRLLAKGWLTTEAGPAERATPPLELPQPGCERPLRALVLPPNGVIDADLWQAARADDRVVYIYRGRLTSTPPRLALWRERLSDVGRSVGLVAAPPVPVIGVYIPPRCTPAVPIVSLIE